MNKFKLKKTSGYTIIELIIVISIVLILAGTAIGASGGIIRGLRFTNTFNKMIFMVQSARNRAVTGRNQNYTAYRIQFSISAPPIPQTATQKSVSATGETILETLTLEATTGLSFTSAENCTEAVIEFTNGSGSTSLQCVGGTDPNPPLLQIGLQEGTSTRTKTFLIHRAAGIPQELP